MPTYFSIVYQPSTNILDICLRAIAGFPCVLLCSETSKAIMCKLLRYTPEKKVHGKPSAKNPAAKPAARFAAPLAVRWARYMTLGFMVPVFCPLVFWASSTALELVPVCAAMPMLC